MIKKIRRFFDKAYKNSLSLHESFESKTENNSIVFISFHKCATSFFSKTVLKEIKSYNHIDYLQKMYGNSDEFYPLINEKGFIYGVIRLQDKDHPRYEFVKKLIRNTTKVKVIFWIRDPRDILVSMYYSFGFSHGVSTEKNLATFQTSRKARIQSMTIDEYVMAEAKDLAKKFNDMILLVKNRNESVVLKYEDMILHYDSFYKEFSSIMGINNELYQRIYDDTRPNIDEDISSHKRSGLVGGFRNKLRPQTIVYLDNELSDVLDYFGYVK